MSFPTFDFPTNEMNDTILSQGLLSFTLDIKDYDYFSAADDVDRFNFKEEQIVPTPWMESVKWKTISLGGPGHPSTMSLAYHV